MAEPKTPPNDKSKKSRSIGSFALFLLVLVALFMVFGGSRMESRIDLSQDQYYWHLYSGEVDHQELRGSNIIEGTLKDKRTFSVQFADVAGHEAELRELKAAQNFVSIRPAELELALSEGWYKPVTARHLTAYGDPNIAALVSEKGEGSAAKTARVQQADRFVMQVLAKPLSAWREKHLDDPKDPPFALPALSGSLWLEVADSGDYSKLEALAVGMNVPVKTLAFDISKDKGTSAKDSNSLLTNLLLLWAPWVLIILVFLFFMRQMRNQGSAGGVMNFGRSRAQIYNKESHTNTTFDDVAGADEAKEEVREVVEFLKNPGRFTRIGGRIPRGILLVGPPGCGKTLLAKAIAGEAEVPFFSISGSDFVEMFVGVGASRVRDLFKQARESSPCIIFLDEIDAVGRRRGSGMGGGHDEREQTLNAILVEMDGFGTDEGIIVVAATNRVDVLDPALLRPGRFDREVVIDLPDVKGREQILRVHLKKVKHSPDIDISVLGRSTPGYSGADLAAIINEAAIMAALQKKEEIALEHLEEARDKVRFGRQKRSRKMEEEDRRVTAIHEAGHAVVAASIPDVDPPHKVTIVPRGRSLGATMILPDKESYHLPRKKLVGQLAWMFGGRASEEVFCGDISAGASDDIRRATELARAMVTELGMSDKIGPINYAERQGSEFLGTELMSAKWHSEETAREIDQEIQRFLTDAYQVAVGIVKAQAVGIQKITEALMRYETINGDDIKRLLAGASVEDVKPVAEKPRATPNFSAGASSATPQVLPGDLPKPGLSPA